MLTANNILNKNNSDDSKTNMIVVASFEERQKSRHRTQTRCGHDLGWFIERGYVLQEGDILQCDDGSLVKVNCADESVSTAKTDDPLLLLKAAYHLGNRHVALQVASNFLRYQHDHVLDEMVVGLGLSVNHEHAPFHPESGAYSHTSHGHAHSGHTHEH